MQETERSDKGDTAISDEQKRLTGIGGLLILPIIGLFLTIIFNGLDLYSFYTDWGFLQELRMYGVEVDSLYICVGVDVVIIASAIFGLYYIFSPSAVEFSTRNVIIAYYIMGLAGTLVYLFFMGQYESSLNAAAGEVISNYANEAMGRIGVSIGWTIVWIIYWCHSKRVEYTFR